MPKKQPLKPIQVRTASGRQFEVKRTGKRAEKKAQPRRRVPSPMVGLAMRSRAPQVRSSDMSTKTHRTTGTEFIGTVTGSGAATAGTMLFTLLVGPNSLGVGRLKVFSTLYEKYRFRKFRLRYVPIANATVSGQVMGYFDQDPTDVAPATTPLVAFQRGVAHYGAKTSNVWESRDFELMDDEPKRLLYSEGNLGNTTVADVRMLYQARFTLLAASALTAVPLGNLYLDYIIDFVDPQIDERPVAGSAVMIQSGGSASQSNPLGTATTYAVGSSLTPISVVGSVITLPRGTYLAVAQVAGADISAVAINTASLYTSIQQEVIDCIDGTTNNSLAMTKVHATQLWSLTLSCTATSVNEAFTWVYIVMMPDELVAKPKPDVETRLQQLEQKFKVPVASEKKISEAPPEKWGAAGLPPAQVLRTPSSMKVVCESAETDYVRIRK